MYGRYHTKAIAHVKDYELPHPIGRVECLSHAREVGKFRAVYDFVPSAHRPLRNRVARQKIA
jgi:hypothetical protein